MPRNELFSQITMMDDEMKDGVAADPMEEGTEAEEVATDMPAEETDEAAA